MANGGSHKPTEQGTKSAGQQSAAEQKTAGKK